MDWIELIGILGSVFVLISFLMKDILVIRIINIVGQFLNYKVEYLGCVFEDPIVQASVIRQKPFMIVNPTSKPAVCLKHIVGKIEKTEPEYSEGVASFLKKFLGKRKSY